MFAVSWTTIACLLVSSGSQPAAAQQCNDYTVPTPTISVLSPSGIRFEIAEPNAGVSLIAYHYSINVVVPEVVAGKWNVDVTRKDGYFVHENQLVTVNNGDTVYYWVYAVHNGLGCQLLNRQWTYRAGTSSPPPASSSVTTVAAPSTLSHDEKSTATVSTASSPSLDASEGLSTRDAIILGVVLGFAVVLAAILSAILIIRSRRNSKRRPAGSSAPPVDKPPEASPARPSSDGQSHLYAYVDDAYSRGSSRGRLPDESAWPDAAEPLRAQAGPHAGSRPRLPLPPNMSRASTTPATDNYYIHLIT